MKPPTANELVGPPPHCLDQERTLESFLGKTQAEAEDFFRIDRDTASIIWMAEEGLNYYLPSAFNYLKSKASENDFGFALSLVLALESQVTRFGKFGQPLVLIKQIADYCDTNRAKLGLDSMGEGLGDLREKFEEDLQSIRSGLA